MRLKRNEPEGRGKYAVVKLEKVKDLTGPNFFEALRALAFLENAGVLTYGGIGDRDEFFVIMLKDRCARPALLTYAGAASVKLGDKEYSNDVFELARRASQGSKFCKDPD